MDQNESDGEGGWGQPPEYVSPWASRDTGGEGGDGAAGYAAGGYGAGGYGGAGWEPPGPPPRRPRRSRPGVYLAVAALAAAVGAVATVALGHPGAGSPPAISASDVPVPHDNAAGSSPALNVAGVEAKVEPGLVDITALLKYDSETAEGTGMILSSSGLVLTNNHVIDGATSVTVSLAETRQRYQAQVIGYDSTHDVALLKLTGASGLATVSFGNSSQVKLGIPVLALGDADGQGGVRPAAGLISGLDRSIRASDAASDTTEDLSHMLQTSAPIEQGDSGGALVNSAGQVIGMITAANTGPAGRAGTTGFAVPIDSALAIARQIAAGQPSSSVYIGVPGFLGVLVGQTDSTSPQQQAAQQRHTGQRTGTGPACVTVGEDPGVPAGIAPAGSGALILGVLCGTAADARGLAPGDVIISVNGQAVTSPNGLTAITGRYHPGDVVSVGWEGTNGARHTTSITLGHGPPR